MNQQESSQKADALEQILLSYLDDLKGLLSPKLWENEILECSKNEVMVLLYLYRNRQANMTQLAEYISAPLNTATGIIARQEKKGYVLRERSREDKRVVVISLTETGFQKMKALISQLVTLGRRVLEDLSREELALAGKMFAKLLQVLKEEDSGKKQPKKVRRILIE